MAFEPKIFNQPAKKELSRFDKRLAILNAKLQIEREQQLYKNPDEVSLQYKKRRHFDRKRAINDQGGKCAICRTEIGTSIKSHYDDHDPQTLRPRGIICNRCAKLMRKDQTKLTMDQDKAIKNYLARYENS